MRPKQVTRRWQSLEMLEQRVCLAVDVGLSNGLLSITSDVGGTLAVNVAEIPPSSGAFFLIVNDNGSDVGEPVALGDVTGGLQLSLSGEGATADNIVEIDLGAQTVPRIGVNLGDGTNSLALANGNVSGSVTVRGGSGADNVDIAANVDGVILLALGGGENDIDVDGTARAVLVRTGDGADQLTIASTAAIDQLFASLGKGTNQTNIEGVVDRVAHIDGRDGSDSVVLSGTVGHLLALLGSGNNDVTIGGDVERSATIRTRGNGSNSTDTVNVAGDVGGHLLVSLAGGANALSITGAIDGGVAYHGGRGDDEVTLSSAANIGGSVVAHMGNGANTFASQALIANSVLVITTNPQDATRVTVDETKVAGQTVIRTARPWFRELLDRLADFFN